MGFPRIPDSRLQEFVGPPPKAMYQIVYSLDEETALQAAKYHREYGKEKAIYEAEKYPGIYELLEKLKKSEYKLAVATLKSQAIAEKVLSIHGIGDFFDCIVGMDENESLTKCDTIRFAMKKTSSKQAVLIGDSIYDYDGAQEAKIDFIGVLYGFGIKEKTDAFQTVEDPLEIMQML